tara:strand:+ start:4223 stop:4528 length:306 start_codon:yes stop_codon:yes gene_type:complete
MTKKGPLSKKDKEYIESHSDAKPKDLAKKLDRAEGTVEKYLNSIKKTKASRSLDQFARNDRGSTVMTQSASEMGDEFRKPKSPSSRTRQCITSIREVHNPR